MVFIVIGIALTGAAAPLGAGERIASPAQDLAEAPAVAGTSRFALHANPWVNLHHFLYQWARAEARPAAGRRPLVPVAERPELERLDTAERQAWREAVDFYAEQLIQYDLLFDADMRWAAVQLGGARALTGVDGQRMPDGWVAALERGAPIYLKHWWPRHEKANRDWIADTVPRLERFGETIATGLAAVYGGRWPAEAVRVDVTAYANWAGAYTSDDPAHITVSSIDPDIQQWGALEILMHEVSHIGPLGGALRRELGRLGTEGGLELHARPPARGDLLHGGRADEARSRGGWRRGLLSVSGPDRPGRPGPRHATHGGGARHALGAIPGGDT